MRRTYPTPLVFIGVLVWLVGGPVNRGGVDRCVIAHQFDPETWAEGSC